MNKFEPINPTNSEWLQGERDDIWQNKKRSSIETGYEERRWTEMKIKQRSISTKDINAVKYISRKINNITWNIPYSIFDVMAYIEWIERGTVMVY